MNVKILNLCLLIILYFIFQINSIAQIANNSYFVGFIDKNYNNYSIDKAENFLSKRALSRRAKQNIKINYFDLPISDFYVDSIKALGVNIINKSKWLNGVTIYTEEVSILQTIKNLSFVDTVVISNTKINKKDPVAQKKYDIERLPDRIKNEENKKKNYYNYGKSFAQINMNNGQFLHNEGYRGENMLIAIIDNGFKGVDKYDAFENLRSQNRIIDTYNFVKSNDSIYKNGTHGTSCLSIMCSDVSNELIGSAPNANYVLLVSEDNTQEEIIEEYNWISAAEFADSIGADIISVSLGYYKFDTNIFNHNYYELDGKTTVISRAATIAASKGMIICVAAANSYSWINVPADADSILTVGAVYPNGQHAIFSSVGYSADGRVKPDVVAMGTNVFNQGQYNSINSGQGTSFATPIIAGLTACLWQKFPHKNNIEIIDAIRKSSNNYFNPTNTCGYGIPNFEIASLLLEDVSDKDSVFYFSYILKKDNIAFNFAYNCNDKMAIKIANSDNEIVYKEKIKIQKNRKDDTKNTKKKIMTKEISLDKRKAGIYEIRLKINKKNYVKKIIIY